MNRCVPLLSSLVLTAFGAAVATGEVSVPAFFSDHAVLQADSAVPVWGKGEPGETVKVTLGAAQGAATVGSEGKWRVDLDLSKVGKGPFELVVSGSNQLKFTDILVGQVWMCSGQSNMEWPLRVTNGGEEEAAQSANPELRQFKVEKAADRAPQDDVKGKWTIAGPEASKDFTAAGYYFGKALQKELGAPIGLLNTTWGGTPVEAWTRTEALDTDPDLAAGREKAQSEYEAYQDFATRYRAWAQKYGRQDREGGKPAEFTGDPGGWEKKAQLPGLVEPGAIWFSRKITLPESAVHKGLDLFLGDVVGDVKIFWDGQPVGKGGVDSSLHRYSINGKWVTKPEGILALRIYSAAAGTGIAPGQSRFRVGYAGGLIQLEGEWAMKAEFTLPPVTEIAEPCPERPSVPLERYHVAGYVYNAMMHPLIPYALAGVCWYQGEANVDRAGQYATAFPLFINDLRAQWGWADLPFYFCQLPNFNPFKTEPSQGGWAELREAQAAALKLPKTGMAVLIDVGDPNNLHPGDKKSVGERLALLALARDYGRQVAADAPLYASSAREGAKFRIQFQHAEGGLVAKPAPNPETRPGSQLQGFAICGADRKWAWADAKIDGHSVLVWNDAILEPIAVRYAWADNPSATLFSAAGLPAAPFRTDDFPLLSAKKKY